MGVLSKGLRVAGTAVAAAVIVVACTVSLPDDGKYKCAADSDCGGDGFICFHPESASAFCCKPGDEGCEPGTAAGGGTGGGTGGGDAGGECPGVDLMTDRNNCGVCLRACAATAICTAGTCVAAGETNCVDGVDNDNNGQTDCVDSSCEARSCGTGCICKAGVKAEAMCTGGTDEDVDGAIDCADSDCDTLSCGQGCACFAGGKSEVGCTDAQDNDGDSRVDCADVEADGGGDCPAGRACKVAPNTSACAAGQCQCNGAVSPSTETQCGDGLDNDCSGTTDCLDLNCNTLGCQPDGGRLCFCRAFEKAENANQGACENRLDDDGDGLVDCADALADGGGDCPWGPIFPDGGSVRCRRPNNQLGQCQSNFTCQ